MTAHLQHYFNPLHIYCRLRDIGLSKGKALFFCKVYEKIVFKPLFFERVKDQEW